MEIRITEKNDRLVALLIGEFDNIACIKAKKDLAPLTQQTDHDVEIDCSGLEYYRDMGISSWVPSTALYIRKTLCC